MAIRFKPRKFLQWTVSILCIRWILIIYSQSAVYGPINDLLLPESSRSSNRILLLTAHPDDECMFFGPTLTSLVNKASVILYSLCLSTGNSEGLGSVRRNELSVSLGVLGIPLSRTQVIDHPHLQDNITQLWDTNIISNVVSDFINQHDINIVITFDDKGISGHPNHIALPGGVLRLLKRNPYQSLRLFTLATTPLIPKYTGAFAHLSSKLHYHLPGFQLPASASTSASASASASTSTSNLFSVLPVEDDTTDAESKENSIILVSNLASYAMTFRAMLQHRSQLVWFRWLYVLFSRYMWVNSLVEVPTRQ